MAIIRKLNLIGARPTLTEFNGGMIIQGVVLDPVTLLPLNRAIENVTPLVNLAQLGPTQGSFSLGWGRGVSPYFDQSHYRYNIGNQTFPGVALAGTMDSTIEADTTWHLVPNSAVSISKLRQSDGYQISTTAIGSVSGTGSTAAILHEDASYVLIAAKTNTTTRECIQGQLAKSTGITTYANIGVNGSEQMLLAKDANSIVTGSRNAQGSAGSIQFHYRGLSPYQTTNTLLLSLTVAQIGMTNSITQARTTTGTGREVYTFGATTTTLLAQRVTFDTANSATKTNTACTFDYTKAANGYIALPTGVAADENVTFDSWLSTISGTTYILCGLVTPCASTSAVPASTHTLYAYEIDATVNTKLYYRYAAPAFTSKPRAIIPFGPTLSSIVVATDATLEIWNFVPGTGFAKQSSISMKPVNIGFDSQGRLWAVDDVNNLHLLTPTLTATVIITFGATSYSYTGSTIASTIAVSAYNFVGTRIATNVQVVVEGPFLSFSDGSKVKTLTTSSTADVSTPIQITGAGYLKAYANIVP